LRGARPVREGAWPRPPAKAGMARLGLPYDSDETSLLLHHEGFYLQISFSELHPLMVLHLARGLEKPGTPKRKARLNDLNLKSVLGSHAINEEVGCFTYRAAHWLEAEITLSRFHEILGRCTEEAQRGYALLVP